MNDLTIITLAALVGAAICGAIAGWVMNVYAIFTGFDAMQTGEIIIRIIGIFIYPIGMIVGWL